MAQDFKSFEAGFFSFQFHFQFVINILCTRVEENLKLRITKSDLEIHKFQAIFA